MPGIPLLYRLLGVGFSLIALAIAVYVHLGNDAKTERKLTELTGQAGSVLAATRIAANNPKLKWDGTAGQIMVMGENQRALRIELEENNATIDQMARDAVRLKARADELRVIAAKAQAQREAALSRLSDMAITPGTREDCMTLLGEAEEALDTIYEAGL